MKRAGLSKFIPPFLNVYDMCFLSTAEEQFSLYSMNDSFCLADKVSSDLINLHYQNIILTKYAPFIEIKSVSTYNKLS